MGNNIFNIASSLMVVALITTLVLPGRQTPAVISATAGGVAQDINSALGMNPSWSGQ